MILGPTILGVIIHPGGIVRIIGAGAAGMPVTIVLGMIHGGARHGDGAIMVIMEDIILIIIISLMLRHIITDMIMVVLLMAEMVVRVVIRQAVVIV